MSKITYTDTIEENQQYKMNEVTGDLTPENGLTEHDGIKKNVCEWLKECVCAKLSRDRVQFGTVNSYL